jgi:hypothetical protein
MVQKNAPTKLPLAKESGFLDDLVRGTSGRENTQNILATAVGAGMPVSRDSIDNLNRLGNQAEAIVAGSMFQASLKREGELNSRMAQNVAPNSTVIGSAPAPAASAPAAAPTAKPAATSFPTPSPFSHS